MESDQLRMVSWNLYIPCVSGGGFYNPIVNHPIWRFGFGSPGMSTKKMPPGGTTSKLALSGFPVMTCSKRDGSMRIFGTKSSAWRTVWGSRFFLGFRIWRVFVFFYLYDGWKIRDHNKRTWYIQHIPRFCSNKDQLWMYNEKPTLCFCCFSKLTGCKPSSKNLWNRRGKPPKKGDPIDSVKTNLCLGFWNESDVMKLVKYIDIRCIDVIPIYHIYI